MFYTTNLRWVLVFGFRPCLFPDLLWFIFSRFGRFTHFVGFRASSIHSLIIFLIAAHFGPRVDIPIFKNDWLHVHFDEINFFAWIDICKSVQNLRFIWRNSRMNQSKKNTDYSPTPFSLYAFAFWVRLSSHSHPVHRYSSPGLAAKLNIHTIERRRKK